MPPKPAAAAAVREKKNWLIHMLYVRQDYDQCLTVIEESLKDCKGMAECAHQHAPPHPSARPSARPTESPSA